MRFPVIYIPFLPMAGMAFFPFILVKKLSFISHNDFINHEKIHLRQQLELLLIGFYILYLLHYFYNLIKFFDHNEAYLNIVFEREAYAMETETNYLKNRKFWAWRGFL
jgi:hypothetical protein